MGIPSHTDPAGTTCHQIPWIPVAAAWFPVYPMASQLSQSQLQSEVSLHGEVVGHMEASWATWESMQAFVVKAIFDAFHHFLCLLTSR